MSSVSGRKLAPILLNQSQNRVGPPVEEGSMMNDTTYELVHSATPNELSQAVNERIEKGWWPMGTPFVHGDCFIQAMVIERSADKRLRKTSGDG